MRWRPTAELAQLRARATLLARIRAFFTERDVLEVETPLLMRARAAEAQLQNFTVAQRALQTSPESAMKRLLCAGSGPIYQTCKAFRYGELGRNHNPEFTMLEWYRPGFDFDAMQRETLALIGVCLGQNPVVVCRSYRDVFFSATGLEPHRASRADLAALVATRIEGDFSSLSRLDYLDLIMSSLVEPQFDPSVLTVISDFPAEQAAMAKITINAAKEKVARRFEIYYCGLELANGYDELDDARELAQRLGDTDPALIAAMSAGLPACCGVALGVDRLLMCAENADVISKVISFDYDRC